MPEMNPEVELHDELDLQELNMQEMETAEAPGWATSIGVGVGVSIVTVAWSIT